MAGLISLKRRIKSATNVAKITKAMEMVSAAKMRKAQDRALQTRFFSSKLEEIITNVTSLNTTFAHPFFSFNDKPKNIAILVFSTNKGLCGSLNTNLHKAILKLAHEQGDLNYFLIIAGKKVKGYIPHHQAELIARFTELSDHPTFKEVRAISSLLQQEFLKGAFDAIYAIYPHFISTLKSEIRIKRLLPLSPSSFVSEEDAPAYGEYLIEPNPTEILNHLLPYHIEMTIYQLTLEAKASEHSARMVAMSNASDNASDLIHQLTLDYNRARQAKVTNELLDATSARLALKE